MAKGEKRGRKDNLPTGVAWVMKDQLAHLIQLQAHLYCTAHSHPGRKVFCFVEEANDKSKGGHQELLDNEMTLWAKYIMSQKNAEKDK